MKQYAIRFSATPESQMQSLHYILPLQPKLVSPDDLTAYFSPKTPFAMYPTEEAAREAARAILRENRKVLDGNYDLSIVEVDFDYMIRFVEAVVEPLSEPLKEEVKEFIKKEVKEFMEGLLDKIK